VLYGEVIYGKNEKYYFEFGNDFDVYNQPFLTDSTEQYCPKTSPENGMIQFPKCYILFGLTHYEQTIILNANISQ
jgi:hypothetical protein